MIMRDLLGPADVPDDVLESMVRTLLRAPHATVSSVEVDPVDYALPAITTAGRHWVSGVAEVGGQAREWRMFVKHVHSWSRSPQFQDVPEELRAMAAEMVPWRTEAAIYRSSLREDLPEGLGMPRAMGVFDLDELSQAMWLECVEVTGGAWDLPRYERAAYLLGRLAGSPAVQRYPRYGHDLTLDAYIEGRLRMQVLPMLRDEAYWGQPALLAAFAEVRPRLLAAADRLDELGAELGAFRQLPAHGDACPNNLLLAGDDGFTLIDFGFWGPASVGFDLGQLLVGDVQVGRRGVEDLPERDEACVVAYHRGLADEGLVVPLEEVRRAHALQVLVFSGFSSFITDETPGTADLATRAALARYSLDLLEATESGELSASV